MKKLILSLVLMSSCIPLQSGNRLKGAAILLTAVSLNHYINKAYASLDNSITPVLVNYTTPYWATYEIDEIERKTQTSFTWTIKLFNWKGDIVTIVVPMTTIDQKAPSGYNSYTANTPSLFTHLSSLPFTLLNSFSVNQEQLFNLSNTNLPSATYLANFSHDKRSWALKINNQVVCAALFDQACQPTMNAITYSYSRAFIGRGALTALASFGGVALKNTLSLGTAAGMVYGAYKLIGLLRVAVFLTLKRVYWGIIKNLFVLRKDLNSETAFFILTFFYCWCCSTFTCTQYGEI